MSDDRKLMRKKKFDCSNETKTKIQLSEEMNLLYFYTIASCAPLPCKYHSYLQSQFNAAIYNTIIIIVMIIIINIHIHHACMYAFIPLLLILSVQGHCNTFNFVAFSFLLIYSALFRKNEFFFSFWELEWMEWFCLILAKTFSFE